MEDSDDFDDVSDTLHAMGANYVWKNTGSIVDRLKKARSGGLPRLGLDCIGSTTLSRICEAMFPEGACLRLVLGRGQSKYCWVFRRGLCSVGVERACDGV